MYGNVNGDDATAQNLFQQFHIHELKTNMQAAECKTHTQRIQAFRALPPKFPSGVVGHLDIVPYVRTFVQYDGTFGAPD